VFREVVDRGSVFGIMPDFVKSIVCGFARMEGHTVAVIANTHLHLSGRRGKCTP
jgi:acetyl-CoA carboxylase carboxyltransferase component